jgi:hypothetical protein
MNLGTYYEKRPLEITKLLSERLRKQIYDLTCFENAITIARADVLQLKNKTVVILRNESNDCLGLGWALRGKKDKYNWEIGLRVALGRAVLHMLDTFIETNKKEKIK